MLLEVFFSYWNWVLGLYYPLLSKYYISPLRALTYIFSVLTQPWPDTVHKEGHHLFSSILSKAALTLQDTKSLEFRQSTTSSFLEHCIHNYQPHAALPPVFSYPAGLLSFHHISCINGCTKSPSSKTEGLHGQYLLHTFTQSICNTISWFPLLQCSSRTANQAISPKQIPSIRSLDIQYREKRKFLLLHI